MSKKNYNKKIKKICRYIIIPTIILGIIFPFILNESKNSFEYNDSFLNSIKTKNNYSNETSKIVLKSSLPDNSQIFAGEIYNKLINSNGNKFYQRQIFDAFFEIINPVTNGLIIEKEVECIDYRDDLGELTIETRISPWLNGGNISPTFSPKQTFIVSGFKKYTAPTTVALKPNFPKNKKPSEINESNITNYLTIENFPNSYEVQPKTSFEFNPNDDLGVLDVNVTLSTAIVENPTSNTFYFQNAPKVFNIRIENLKRQPATILPTSDTPIDGSSLDVIAQNVNNSHIKELIFLNSRPLPIDFNIENNIFDIVITSYDNEQKTVVFNAKIFNIYDSEGLLISNKADAILLESITINNLREPTTTTLSLKKEGSNDVLAQSICENKTDSQIIEEFIQIDNAPASQYNFSIRIDQKTYDNLKGTMTLDLIMRNYYELGTIISSESKVYRFIITGFKTVFESTSKSLNQVKSIYASDVNLTNSLDQNYVEKFIMNKNYPEGTTFAYKLLDVNNVLGTLKIEVVPSKWYDSQGNLINNNRHIQLIIENFKVRKPTTVEVNKKTTSPEMIGNIYASDTTDEQLKTYIQFNSAPSNLNYEIKNIIRKNSSQSVSFDVVLHTYYNDKGLLVTSPSKTFKLVINGFKYRGKSSLVAKPESSNVIPSNVNESNWQEYISIENFPTGTTFTSISFEPVNKDGTLLISVIPSKFYNVYGNEVNNDENEKFELFVAGMLTKNKTIVNPLSKNSSNESLFNIFPEELDKKITSSSNPKDILKDYIYFVNPYSNSIDDYEIIYNSSIDPNTKYNNISGEITFKVIFKNYYNEFGNPVTNDLDANYQFYVTVGNFKKVVPNYLISANINKNLSSVDPYELISNPELIMDYICFPEQIDIPLTEYKGPDVQIVSISGGPEANTLLDQGLVYVEYKINNYFDSSGNFISKDTNVENWDVKNFVVGGFKSRINSDTNVDFIAIISIIIATTIVLIILIICLGILFKKKRYYINENYDRGLINANETTIPLVIKTNDKIKNTKPKLIPLIKEQKPPKPLKKYKPIKHKEAKVKPPKQPILPGQRKREMIEWFNNSKVELKQKIKKSLDFSKFPINEPFEIDNKWYFKNEEGKYFIANENNEWNETKKPKIKKQKMSKEQKVELKKQKKDKKNQN